MELLNSKNVQKRPYKAYIGGFRLYSYIAVLGRISVNAEKPGFSGFTV